MDPNLFAINWEQTAEVLTALVVAAFLVERALSLLFESKLYLNSPIGKKDYKEVIAFVASFLMCFYWKLDAPSVIFHGEKISWLGMAISAAVIAGGSKASLKLFRDVLGVENEQAKIAREASNKKEAARAATA